MDIKYLRILWLDKKIKELKEKIRLKKLGCIILVVLLAGCVTTQKIPEPNIFPITFDQQILNSFKTKEQRLLIQAIENSKYIQGLTRFDIAAEINDFYKKQGVNRFDFYKFLKKKMDIRDDIKENIVNQIEKNYYLLEEMQNEN